MAREEKKSSDVFTLPEGRVINHSVFTMDAFDEKSKPSYKIEIAIEGTPETNSELADLEERLLDFADEYWGSGAGDDPDLVLPFLDGDKLAKKREKKGKDGDAYKGMTVIRANTIFNKDGVEGPGGIQVFDPDVEPLGGARQGEFYQGCYAEAAVIIGPYETNDGDNALKFYLSAVQKTKDGEKLVSATDRSTLFKPTGRAGGGEASGGRRRRRNRE